MKMKKQTDIPKAVRESVLTRDSFDECPCCVVCGRPSPKGLHLHHYISRGSGGKGIEENLVSLCFDCHGRLHNGNQDIKRKCKEYLISRYEDWDEDSLRVEKEVVKG